MTASTGAAMAAPVSVAQAGVAASATDLQGTLVFQQSPGGMIYVYDLETGALQELTNGFDPAISPDGTTVAFVRDGGAAGLYLIGSDGSDERLIFGERGQLSSPKWSPDGQWLVFSRNDESIECYDMGFNRCVTQDELDDMLKRMPQGAPGGDTADFPLVKQYQHQLSAVDLNGANFHDIVALDSALAPDWGDGGIVYQSSAGLQRTADASGAVNELVAFDYLKPFYYDPDWQPGGGQIAFQVKGAAQWEIYVVNPDGAGMTALTRPVTALVDELAQQRGAGLQPRRPAHRLPEQPRCRQLRRRVAALGDGRRREQPAAVAHRRGDRLHVWPGAGGQLGDVSPKLGHFYGQVDCKHRIPQHGAGKTFAARD